MIIVLTFIQCLNLIHDTWYILLRVVKSSCADHRLCRFSAIKLFVSRSKTPQVNTNGKLSM